MHKKFYLNFVYVRLTKIPIFLAELSLQMNNEGSDRDRPRPRMGGPHLVYFPLDPLSQPQNNQLRLRNRILFPHDTGIHINDEDSYIAIDHTHPQDRFTYEKIIDNAAASLRRAPAPLPQVPQPLAPRPEAPQLPAPQPSALQTPARRP